MLRRLTEAAVLSALLAGAATMNAEPSRFRRPVMGERLDAGGSFEVSWTVDRARVAAFDEMELVLSLDGGRTFPLRVTGEISPDSNRLTWRVPALSVRQARLALRLGSDGEPDSESIAAVSDVFEISPRVGLCLEELFRVGGEWRTREAAPHRSLPVADGISSKPADRVGSAPAGELAAEQPAPAVVGNVEIGELPHIRPRAPTLLLSSTVLQSAPLYPPLRQ